MLSQLLPAFRMLLALTLLTGVAYPLAVTGLAQVLFPHQANGSLVRVNDVVIGSELIGQASEDARYFWPRPSAAGYSGLDPHISPAAAQLQLERVAAARHFTGAQREQLAALIARHTEPPQFGWFGQSRVNVLQLNLAVDEIQ